MHEIGYLDRDEGLAWKLLSAREMTTAETTDDNFGRTKRSRLFPSFKSVRHFHRPRCPPSLSQRHLNEARNDNF